MKNLMPAVPSVPRRVVLWRRIEDDLGFDQASLRCRPDGFEIAGTILAACDGSPLQADYRIYCDAAWRMRAVEIAAALGEAAQHLVLVADGEGRWQCDGRPAPHLDGCLDVDLEYTPATNAFPINRLALGIGMQASVAAAWVRFPRLSVERSEQTYIRLAQDTFLYRSGTFEAALEVDVAGLPIRYEGIWLRVADGGGPPADFRLRCGAPHGR